MTLGVSIIVCTYNGSSKLTPTLNAIAQLRTEYPWEVIVVDNASTDNTFLFCQEYLSNSSIDYRVLQHSVPGKMNAFWMGVKHARYNYILDCDDDNHLNQDYLQQGLAILMRNSRIGALGGCGSLITDISVPSWFNKYSKSYALGPQAPNNGRLPNGKIGLYGAGSFFSTAALHDLRNKGFESVLSCRKGDSLTSGGDTELCYAMSKLGYEIWYSGNLHFGHAITPNRLTWDYYLKLKQGIASSFPLLDAYRFQDFSSDRQFKLYLLGQFLLAVKGYLKSIILFSSEDKDLEVARQVCKTKIKVFKNNYKETMRASIRLRTIFPIKDQN